MSTSNDSTNPINDEISSTDNNIPTTNVKEKNISNEAIVKNAIFVEKESNCCCLNNQQYELKRKELQLETVAQRRKRIAKETAAELSKPISIPFELMLDKEIRRIMEFDMKERILQSQTKFRWVTPCCQNENIFFNLRYRMDFS